MQGRNVRLPGMWCAQPSRGNGRASTNSAERIYRPASIVSARASLSAAPAWPNLPNHVAQHCWQTSVRPEPFEGRLRNGWALDGPASPEGSSGTDSTLTKPTALGETLPLSPPISSFLRRRESSCDGARRVAIRVLSHPETGFPPARK